MRLTVLSLPNATSFRRPRRPPSTSLATDRILSSRVGDLLALRVARASPPPRAGGYARIVIVPAFSLTADG